MDVRITGVITVTSLALAGCERSEAPPPAATPPDAARPMRRLRSPQREPCPSSIASGSSPSRSRSSRGTALFLSDGTLVMASPNSTPAFGQWHSKGGRLTITEEGRNYPTEILALGRGRLPDPHQRPGRAGRNPVRAGAAGGPRSGRTRGACRCRGTRRRTPRQPSPRTAPPAPVNLLGTAWRLESLGNGKLQAGTQPSLEFPTEGRAGGNGSCNRFNGIVIVAGDGIKFSGFATTRKACAEAVMRAGRGLTWRRCATPYASRRTPSRSGYSPRAAKRRCNSRRRRHPRPTPASGHPSGARGRRRRR